MPIGNGPDCYNGINKEEDEQIKLQDMVEKWWHTLGDNYKFDLLDGYFEGEPAFTSIDNAWNGLDWNDKWNIYRDEKDEVYV